MANKHETLEDLIVELLSITKCSNVLEVINKINKYNKEMEDYSNYHITTKVQNGGELNFFTTAVDHKRALQQLQTNSWDFQNCYKGDRDIVITIKKLPN